MPFQPGQSGNANGSRERHVFDALLRTIKQQPAKLKQALEAQLDQAAAGNLASLDWIACRLEGKAVQSVAMEEGSNTTPLAAMVIQAMLGLSERSLTMAVGEQPLTIVQGVEEKTSDPHPPSNTAEGVPELGYSPTDLFVQNSDLLVSTNVLDENSV
jgi:hypothetical protein